MREAVLEQRAFESLAAVRREAEAERVACRAGDATILDLPADSRACIRRKLLPEPCGSGLVHLEERLALGRVGALLVALLHFGKRHPEALREQLHRIGESGLLVQLEELEDVAADVAAKAMEKTLVAVDVKRRRLLAVERTESLVGRAGLLQRHVVLNHDDDVGLVLQVVDELLRE